MVVAPSLGAYMSWRWLRFFVIGFTFLLTPLMVVAETHALLIQGLGGEAWYQRQFDEQVELIGESLKGVIDEAHLTILDVSAARREAVVEWFDTVATGSVETDSVLIIMVGHGTFDGQEYKFNISGPDLTSGDIRENLDRLAVQGKVLLNTSSSSGALLELLSGESTTLLTATKNGNERNATRFGRFFARALGDTGADLDKNQKISLQEAFDHAERATSDFYDEEGLLATEHAQLSDSSGAQLAARMTLANLGGAESLQHSPELTQLIEERDQIDREVESLRLQRIGMSDEDYQFVFQSLMLELISVQDEIELLEGGDVE
jgi:hypothetical protein